MVIYSREKVARLREQYPAGTRICLNSMDGEAGMPKGLEGTVQYVDDAGQLGVKWDNGRSLSLIPGVDSFHKKEGHRSFTFFSLLKAGCSYFVHLLF